MGVWKPKLLLFFLLLFFFFSLVSASREEEAEKVVTGERKEGLERVFDPGPRWQPSFSAGALLRNSERRVPHASDPLHNR